MLEKGQTKDAVESVADQLRKFPDNVSLQLFYGSALSADYQDDVARDYVREKLNNPSLPVGQRRAWLHLQAQIELDANDPSYLTLDLALQKALEITPNAPDLIAMKGASLVLRGKSEDGGNLLAHAWRRNDGGADDSSMLAYLTIAARRCRDRAAYEHFRHAFEQINRSEALRLRVEKLTGEIHHPV